MGFAYLSLMKHAPDCDWRQALLFESSLDLPTVERVCNAITILPSFMREALHKLGSFPLAKILHLNIHLQS
jgi:hypothetical protein